MTSEAFEKYRLSVPISRLSRIVIVEDTRIEDFLFKKEGKTSENKGVIETSVTNSEYEQKLEEIKSITAFFSLLKSEESNRDSFLYVGEPLFFNVKTIGLSPSGEKKDLCLCIGKEETCITKTFIEENFLKYKKIANNQKFIRSLRWYHLGEILFDDADSILAFIVAIEAISPEKTIRSFPEEQLEVIKGCIYKSNIDSELKERATNAISNLKQLSFKEKVETLLEELSDKSLELLESKAKELGLTLPLVKLLTRIYSDSRKVAHRGRKEVEDHVQKRKWLEIFIRKVLIHNLNLCLHNEKK